MIKISNVCITFKDTVIRYEDTEFQKNKITFIKGQNGLGKTTLLKAIAKLVPYSGTINYTGFATYNRQHPVLFHMSVYDNITYPLRIRNKDITKYDEVIKEYAKRLGIDHLLQKDATLCSSGEQMKTSIIRSLIFSPDILLLDEPTTSLDIASINELTILLRELKKDMTIIISSHDRLFIEDLEDEIYELGDQNVQR